MQRAMSETELEQFIDSKPGWIILTTIGADGFPHSVPLGYFRDGTKIYLGCKDHTQKIRNVERNPKVSLCLESGSTMSDIKGVLLRGTATIVREPEERLSLHQLAARQRGVPEDNLPQSVSEGAAYIKVADYTVTSWNYGS
jgi:general stress protein 26|tara:strand:- start:75 stop:497 length:423 start_codon:yes stop_codon:yes gene_type:complete